MLTNLLRIIKGLMRPRKVQNTINQQPPLPNKLRRRLSHRDDISSRNPDLRRGVEHFLPDITYYNSRTDGAHNLQRVEAQSPKSEEEDGLVALNPGAAGDGVVGCVYGVDSYSGLCGGDALVY